MTPFTGPQLAARAYTVWPLGTVTYSMITTRSPTGHRDDCSGFASAVLGLPTPGLSTVTLVSSGTLLPIPLAELEPGDLVGELGPGTEGADGHVQVVTAVFPDRVDVVEQAGGTKGPTTASVDRVDISGAYRYAARIEETDTMTVKLIKGPAGDVYRVYPTGVGMCLEYFGDAAELPTLESLYGVAVPVGDVSVYGAPLTQIQGRWGVLAADSGGVPAGAVPEHTHTPGGVVRVAASPTD